MTPRTAVILAGGLGTRLRSAVPDRQKVVAEVGGRPFIYRLLEDLEAQGVRQVVLCTGHLAETVRAAITALGSGLTLRYSEEPEPLGTAGALALARPLLPESEPVFVLNGDSFCDVDLGALAAWHRRCGAAATLTLTRVPDTARYGGVTLDDGRVVAFHEKGRTGPGWINAGVYCVGPALLAALPTGRQCSLEREVFPTEPSLYGYCGGGRFIDIGLPDTYRDAADYLDAGRPEDRAAGLVLLDRDGTINREVHYLQDPDKVELVPGAARALDRLRQQGHPIAVVTNQSPIGRGMFGLDTLEAIHRRLAEQLDASGAHWDWIGHCPHTPDDGCRCRKPAPGLAHQAAEALSVPLKGAFVVGDKGSDLGMGRAIGATTILVRTGYGEAQRHEVEALADYCVEDLLSAATTIAWLSRTKEDG